MYFTQRHDDYMFRECNNTFLISSFCFPKLFIEYLELVPPSTEKAALDQFEGEQSLRKHQLKLFSN